MIDILYDYEKATGSRINKEKTRYKYLGKWEGRKDKICDFMLCEGPMDVLGISFGNGEGDALCNWKKKMTAVEKNLGLWKTRKLSVSGKVLVVKADVLPKLLHLAYVFPMPQKYRAQLMRGIFKFYGYGL